ncbi:MAG: DUF1573 domain-containing protein [Bacteroidia bacterium]|nr:DUF1573 domain-containing protein [Bacteroidia bacterium]NNM15959.1 DUF1573 domain-containing protein [Bacteroidia bacterium]
MKKILLTALMLATVCSISLAQTDTKTTPVKQAPVSTEDVKADPNAATIDFDKELHDFGKMEYAGDGTHDFVFTNNGKTPLIITNAKGSCGCTVPKWPREAIAPGESASINVRYDTKRVGPFTKTVTINSNASSAVKVLTIKGSVNAKPADATPLNKPSEGSPLEKN